MKLDTIIAEIQHSTCVKCKVGRALSELKGLKDEIELHGVSAVVADIKTSQRAHSEKSRSVNENPKPSRTRIAPAAEPEPGKAAKACRKCGKVKPLDQFEVSKLTKDGRLGTCRQCRRERARERYAENRRPATLIKEPASPQPETQNNESDRPFECDACGKRFHVKGSLISHKQFNCRGRKATE